MERKAIPGDGGLATEAKLNEPYEVRFDKDGNMYFVEMQNHIVRRLDATTKKITTIAGTGKSGFSGDDGPATKATFIGRTASHSTTTGISTLLTSAIIVFDAST